MRNAEYRFHDRVQCPFFPVCLYVLNSEQYDLPLTGGQSTTFALGLMCILTGLLLYRHKKWEYSRSLPDIGGLSAKVDKYVSAAGRVNSQI